jgi:16S rRNA (uracil1498-N3)-methyltransferase
MKHKASRFRGRAIMTAPRIYQPVPLSPGRLHYLSPQAARHLVCAMRAKIGDRLVIFNGEGGEYPAEIISIHKDKVGVMIAAFVARESEPPISLHLAQGIARGEKMDWIVQKAVELGATRIVPLLTERCNVKLDAERAQKRIQHWRAIAISACEQCGRNRVPEIAPVIALGAFLPVADAEQRFVLSPSAQDQITAFKPSKPASIVLLIGPEGGLSGQEIDMAIQHGFAPLNLGPRVLRTETAAVAGLTALQLQFGDL